MTSSRNYGNLKELLQMEDSKPQQDLLTTVFYCLPYPVALVLPF